jgi:hypothetical protein
MNKQEGKHTRKWKINKIANGKITKFSKKKSK